MTNQFDRLPVELLHSIFIYFRAHEILQAFSNLGDRFDRILSNYDRYILDFRSIRKSQFELTCRLIQPHQVIALILSDNDYTTGLCELFFSRHKVEHFINLRSLEIDTINEDAFKWIQNCKSLLSLKLPRLSFVCSTSLLSNSSIYIPKLHELNRLCMCSIRSIMDCELPRLRHISGVNSFQLPSIFKMMPNLHSLSINLGCFLERRSLEHSFQLKYLKRLEIYMLAPSPSIIDLEELLIKMPNLIHLELDIFADVNLLNGNIWESLILRLDTFDFRFRLHDRIQDSSVSQILNTFRSLFWLRYKRWFVAYDDRDLPASFFTIPRFAPINRKYSADSCKLRCTSSTFRLNEYVNQLTLSDSFQLEYHFPNVTSLVLETKENIDVLTFNLLVNIIRALPRLISLTFSDEFPLTQPTHNIIFEQIRTLYIRHVCQKSHIQSESNLVQLCLIYPRVEHLRISVHTHEEFQILLDTFKYLSSLIVDTCYQSNCSTWPEKDLLTHQWLSHNVRSLSKTDTFTCKILNGTIYLWVDDF
ncbi:hypothetical protein I4U23_003804 [Adineta vaga]|nr:hypothetical protein I4U23_003804 [Adineta vaga]